MKQKKKHLQKEKLRKQKRMANKKFTWKEKWYFTKQDIVSYTMSSVLYVALCLMQQPSLSTFLYSIFDFMLYYTSFWFIRINFDLTYHSNSWATCKLWTRTMLCSGVFLLWILPIKYTLLNGLFVGFLCAFILYLIEYYRRPKPNIYAMSEDELYAHCRRRGLDDADCKIAYFMIIERLKGKELYEAIGYSERQTKRKRKKILDTIQ
jgi:hypothetical protein